MPFYEKGEVRIPPRAGVSRELATFSCAAKTTMNGSFAGIYGEWKE